MEQDDQTAFDWYQKAAATKYPDAIAELGKVYQAGKVADLDYNRAMELYRQAADMGSHVAQLDIGLMYYYGTGEPQRSAGL